MIGAEGKGFYHKLGSIGRGDRKQHLFMRSMTDGILSERDRLLEYTTGEFYQEMSLFLTEAEAREKEMERMKGKKKR